MFHVREQVGSAPATVKTLAADGPQVTGTAGAVAGRSWEVDAAYRLSRYLDLPVSEFARALAPPKALQLPMNDLAAAVPVNASRGGTDG